MKYYYEPPTYNDLTSQQKTAISEEGALTLAGGPGTGKSVVSAHRHISNYRDNRRTSILLTYTKSLRYYLSEIVNDAVLKEADLNKRQRIAIAVRNINLANSWVGNPFDEIIVDECQDLPENELVTLTHPNNSQKKIYRQIHLFNPPIIQGQTSYKENGIDYVVSRWDRGNINYIKKFTRSNMLSYGADDKQIVYPDRSTNQKRLSQLFTTNKEHTLFQNFRNTFNVLMFCRSVLDYDIAQSTLDRLKQENKIGTLPVLKIVKDAAKQDEAILDIISEHQDITHNIAILVPLKRDVDHYKNLLANQAISHSGYSSDMDAFNTLENIHVTTYKSSKGLEFHTVIIPNFNDYQSHLANLHVVNEEDYYVAFTRTKTNLYLISNRDLQISTAVLKRETFAGNQTNAAPAMRLKKNETIDDLPF